MSEAKKHHFLPQWYLRGFACPGKTTHVWQVEKSADQKAYQVAIPDTAAIRDYHAIDNAEGGRDRQSVETELSKVESEQRDLVHRLIRRRQLSTYRRHKLAEFISVMRMRVPSMKEHIRQHLTITVDQMNRMMAEDDRFEKMIEAGRLRDLAQYPAAARAAISRRFRKMVQNDELAVQVANAYLLQFMFSLAFRREAVDVLAAMGVTFVTARGDESFVCSDQPVAVYNSSGSPKNLYCGGIVHPKIELTLPLTASVLVRLDWSIRRGAVESATDEIVREYNRRTIIMAERFIYAPQVSAQLKATISENAHRSAGSRLSVVGIEKDSAIMSNTVVPVYAQAAYRASQP